MHNQFKTQKFKHLMLAMGPRDLNSAPCSPVHCSSHSMTSFQSSELTELPVVENSQLFAQRAHSACTASLWHPLHCTWFWGIACTVHTLCAYCVMCWNKLWGKGQTLVPCLLDAHVLPTLGGGDDGGRHPITI